MDENEKGVDWFSKRNLWVAGGVLFSITTVFLVGSFWRKKKNKLDFTKLKEIQAALETQVIKSVQDLKILRRINYEALCYNWEELNVEKVEERAWLHEFVISHLLNMAVQEKKYGEALELIKLSTTKLLDLLSRKLQKKTKAKVIASLAVVSLNLSCRDLNKHFEYSDKLEEISRTIWMAVSNYEKFSERKELFFAIRADVISVLMMREKWGKKFRNQTFYYFYFFF